MIVGKVLGDTALAAIGSCGSIYELLVGFGLGIGNGLAIVAARSYGAQDHDLLKKTVAGSGERVSGTFGGLGAGAERTACQQCGAERKTEQSAHPKAFHRFPSSAPEGG